jgi:hypothetical protein
MLEASKKLMAEFYGLCFSFLWAIPMMESISPWGNKFDLVLIFERWDNNLLTVREMYNFVVHALTYRDSISKMQEKRLRSVS